MAAGNIYIYIYNYIHVYSLQEGLYVVKNEVRVIPYKLVYVYMRCIKYADSNICMCDV